MPASMGPTKEPSTYEQQLGHLGEVLETLRSNGDTNLLIDQTLAYIKQNFAADYELCWIGLYDHDEHRLFGKGGYTPDGKHSEWLKQRHNLASGDLLEQVVVQRHSLAVADLRQELRAGEWRKVADRYSVQGVTLFPLIQQDRCIGVMLLGSKRWGTFPSTNEKACIRMVLGTLATALSNVELEWQRQQYKRPDKPLMEMLNRLRNLPQLGQRLDAAVEETHRYFGATRTSIYWFEPKQRYFWRRVSNQTKTSGFMDMTTPTSGLTAQELSSFYQSLLSDQIVSIGEAKSSLKADATKRLMQLMKARSLLAAPILYQSELLGFLAIEGTEPRIWQEEEKQFLRAAAQTIALTAPAEEIEGIIHQTQVDYQMISELSQSLYEQSDWRQTITKAAELMGQRLKTDRLFVLIYDGFSDRFETCYQTHSRNRRTLPTHLDTLSPMDWQMVERAKTPVAIENLDEDLRLAAWRGPLLELGIKSLLVCCTSPGHGIEGLLIVGHEAPRAWTQMESQLLQTVSQQLGLILHQWQLQHQMQQQESLHLALRKTMAQMQQITDLGLLEQAGMAAINQLTESPMAALISWFPGDSQAKLVAGTDALDKRFHLDLKAKIGVDRDPLLSIALADRDIVRLSREDIPATSQAWFKLNQPGQVLVLALRTAPTDLPSGIVIVADSGDRRWSDRHYMALDMLAHHLAWCRRTLKRTQALETDRTRLDQLAWYRQQNLALLHRTTQSGIDRLLELTNPKQDALNATRQQQILRQMADVATPITAVLEDEQEQLTFKQEPIPLIGLIRRALDRVDGLIKQRQIWSQVHNDENPMVHGDSDKLDLLMSEILTSACLRSPISGRVDLWCRQFDPHWIEVAITDAGTADPMLLMALSENRASLDALAPTPLDEPINHPLGICQTLAQQMNLRLTFLVLEDGRTMSRLMLPLNASAR
jgi:GAF domain-containing protein